MRTNMRTGLGSVGLVGVLAVMGCAPGSGSPGGGADVAAGKALVANLRGSDGAQAEVEFLQDGGHTEFALAVRGGQPGAVVDVTVNGQVVLSITLDDFGNARVEFDSAPDELGEDPLPASFTDANGGDAVGVGELSGNFEDNDNTDDHGDDDDEDDGDDAGEFELEAQMFSPDSSLKAKVKFQSEGDKSKLEVRVRGGAPGSTLEVVVGGVTLTTLTLDDYGSVKVEFNSRADDDDELPFPADFVAPVAGTPVAVGSLLGTLEVSSDDEDDDGDDDNANDNDADDDDENDNADDTNDDDNENVNDNVDDNVNANDNVDDNANGNDNIDDSEDDNINGNDNGP